MLRSQCCSGMQRKLNTEQLKRLFSLLIFSESVPHHLSTIFDLTVVESQQIVFGMFCLEEFKCCPADASDGKRALGVRGAVTGEEHCGYSAGTEDACSSSWSSHRFIMKSVITEGRLVANG